MGAIRKLTDNFIATEVDGELLIVALEAACEQAIAAALQAMIEKRTVITGAHRGLLPEIADRVIRLDKGRLAGE